MKTNSNFSFSNNFSFNYFHHLFNSLLNAGNKDSLFTVKAGFNNNATFNHYVITNNWAINYKLPKLSFTVNIPYSFYKIINYQSNLFTSFFDKHFLGVNVLVNYNFHKKWSLSTSVSNQFRLSPSFINSNQYILYNYRSLNNNNSIYPYNKNFSIDNFINYKNLLKYTFITLNHKYLKGIYNPIMDNEFHQILHIRKANNGNTYRQSNSILFAYSQYLPKLKSTVKAQLFFENSISDNYSNKIMTRFYTNTYQVSLFTNTKLNNISLETKTSFNISKSRSATININNITIFEQTLTLKTPITINSFITFNNIYNSIKQTNNKGINFLYPDIYFTYSLEKLKTDIEIGAQNLFNKKLYTNIAVKNNVETINQIALRPLQIIVKATVYFK